MMTDARKCERECESERARERERERLSGTILHNGVQGEGEWRYEGQEGKEEVVEEEVEDAEEKEKEEISYVARLEGAVVVAVSGFYFSPYKQAPTAWDSNRPLHLGSSRCRMYRRRGPRSSHLRDDALYCNT
jgi:hypothetical protein